MADEADDVLELDPQTEIEDLDEGEQTDGDVGGDDEETLVTFADEEAAPASEDNSSVIRGLRQANRVMAKKLSAFERANQPQPVEVGPEPTLADCEYDEALFAVKIKAHLAQVAKAEAQKAELESRAEAEARKNQERVEAYKADKARLRVADYETAEEEVEAALPTQIMAMLMRTKQPAALIYGLARSPDKLAALSALNPSTELVEAALMLGEMGAKLKMETRRTAAPERRITGNTGFAPSTDKELARLEKEADRTGDRTALAAYRRKLKA
jgi:hypothetical protein